MKTRKYTLLVHNLHDGTPFSPVVGVATKHGKLWGRDVADLTKRIRFVFGVKPEFTERLLDDSEISASVLRHIGAREPFTGHWPRSQTAVESR